jgi:hypothetical protein
MTGKTPLQILIAARELIADEARWTQNAPARGKSGREVDPNGRHAVCWCLLGAIDRVGGRETFISFSGGHYAIKALCRDGLDITAFNDAPATTHPEVLAKLDEAIASMEGKP